MKNSICFLTGTTIPKLDANDAPVSDYLNKNGFSVEVALWDEFPSIASDVIIVRSTWGYYQNVQGFLEFLNLQEKLGKTIWNSASLISWNSDKVYLQELENKGVSIIPTQFVNCASELTPIDSEYIIIKPSISAGAWNTAKFKSSGFSLIEDHFATHSTHSKWMVQPFIPEIQKEGEWSLIYFNNEFSHAILKTPKDGDFRVQSKFGGHVQRLIPEKALLDASENILSKLPEVPLYARIDGVVHNNTFLLMELELIEPELFTTTPESIENFGNAIISRWEKSKNL